VTKFFLFLFIAFSVQPGQREQHRLILIIILTKKNIKTRKVNTGLQWKEASSTVDRADLLDGDEMCHQLLPVAGEGEREGSRQTHGKGRRMRSRTTRTSYHPTPRIPQTKVASKDSGAANPARSARKLLEIEDELLIGVGGSEIKKMAR
jgi:hypothetical protein